MKIYLSFILLTVFAINGFTQDRYWVFFKDKNNTSFDPYEYFDNKAIERRIANNISLYDSTDHPVSDEYITELGLYVDSITTISRWFNCAASIIPEENISTISQLSFVKDIQPIYSTAFLTEEKDLEISYYHLSLLKDQIAVHNGELFDKNDIRGKGLRIAIFDGGFPSVNTHEAFKHLRDNNQIIKTFDFTKKKEFVYDYSSHGTAVLSCIAGRYEDHYIGMAQEAEFLLARTEVNAEPFSEEENWLAAAEWADKNGADIINSSLGYTYHRYFPEQMDGKYAFVARAANMAASKGILVVNANGNDGDVDWKYIGTPADADSVLSIGGIDPSTEIHTSFSSFGPNMRKKIKPNVCAYGHVYAAGKSGYKKTQGTSFASPLVAGFAACAWQTNRELTNMELFEEIQRSGNLYPYYDYAHGYGVPQANYFVNKGKENPIKTFSYEIEGQSILINDITKSSNTEYLFYHIEDETGFLLKYVVIEITSTSTDPMPAIRMDEFSNGKKVMIHYKNYTETININ
jgi:subtilisin family serine protease